MADYSKFVENWAVLANGVPYTWIVDYPAFSAFGTFELSPEQWEQRHFITNFKGNSELTTEIDHQQAVERAIPLVVNTIKGCLAKCNGNLKANEITLICVPAAQQENTERRYKQFCQEVCQGTSLQNAYDHIQYDASSSAETKRTGSTPAYVLDASFFKGRNLLVFDDIIASGRSLCHFTNQLRQMGAYIIGVIALGKTISDGYEQKG